MNQAKQIEKLREQIDCQKADLAKAKVEGRCMDAILYALEQMGSAIREARERRRSDLLDIEAKELLRTNPEQVAADIAEVKRIIDEENTEAAKFLRRRNRKRGAK